MVTSSFTSFYFNTSSVLTSCFTALNVSSGRDSQCYKVFLTVNLRRGSQVQIKSGKYLDMQVTSSISLRPFLRFLGLAISTTASTLSGSGHIPSEVSI